MQNKEPCPTATSGYSGQAALESQSWKVVRVICQKAGKHSISKLFHVELPLHACVHDLRKHLGPCLSPAAGVYEAHDYVPHDRWVRLSGIDPCPPQVSVIDFRADITAEMALTYRQACEAQLMLKHILLTPDFRQKLDSLRDLLETSYDKFRWKLGGLLMREAYPTIARHFGFTEEAHVMVPLRAIQAHGTDLLMQTNHLELELLMNNRPVASSLLDNLKKRLKLQGKDLRTHFQEHPQVLTELELNLPEQAQELKASLVDLQENQARTAATWAGAKLLEHALQPDEDALQAEARLSAAIKSSSASAIKSACQVQRAAVRLQLGLYDAALADAISADAADGAATVHAAACVGLGRYSEALRVGQAQQENAMADHVVRHIRRLQAHSQGTVDVLDAFNASVPALLPRIGEFRGPVRLSSTSYGRRCLSTTCKVAAGDLLLSSRAVVFMETLSQMRSKSQPGKALNIYKQAAQMSHHAAFLFAELLSDGTERQVVPMDRLFWHASHDQREAPSDEVVQGVISTNAFKDLASAIFPAASMANHSCIPSALVIKVGEALLLRARRPMAAGEEVTINYFDVMKPLVDRQQMCQVWGFTCDCCRCQDERKVPGNKLQEPAVVLAQLKATMQIPVGIASAITHLEARVRDYLGQSSMKQVRGVCAGYLALYSSRAQEEGSHTAVGEQLKLLEAVLPGSFAHCKIALEHWRRCSGYMDANCLQNFSADGAARPGTKHPIETAWAQVSCVNAHRLRYGDPGITRMPHLLEHTRRAIDAHEEEFCIWPDRAEQPPRNPGSVLDAD